MGEYSTLYEFVRNFFLIAMLIILAIYIIEALILNSLNKKIYGEGTWQAWVPFANVYLLGKLTVNKTVGWILLILAFFSGREEGIGETLNNIYSLAVFVLFIYAIVKLSQLKNGKLDPNAERIRIDGKNAVIDSSVVITDNTNHESVPASPGTKYCPSCGSLQESAAKFCTNCGQKLD